LGVYAYRDKESYKVSFVRFRAPLTGMVALSLIREIVPVTALICAGKVSSGIGAELGSM
jgi:ABC-type transporter Mla maintaining outer membrane lipid asymmetry permease subunit MlaE